MKTKKSPKADLEKKRGLFLEIGLVIALAICFAAFEWSTETVEIADLGKAANETIIEQDIISTDPDDPEKYEEPEPEPIEVIEIFDVKDDSEDVERVNFDSEVKDNNPPTIILVKDDIIPETATDPVPWFDVEKKPLFPGGDAALLKFINENTKYPKVPKELGIDGTVTVKFVIDKTGKVINAEIAKGVDPYLDAEALRVVSLIPNWEPGKQREIPVPVTFYLPIKFILL